MPGVKWKYLRYEIYDLKFEDLTNIPSPSKGEGQGEGEEAA